jgi:hypothetical protein
MMSANPAYGQFMNCPRGVPHCRQPTGSRQRIRPFQGREPVYDSSTPFHGLTHGHSYCYPLRIWKSNGGMSVSVMLPLAARWALPQGLDGCAAGPWVPIMRQTAHARGDHPDARFPAFVQALKVVAVLRRTANSPERGALSNAGASLPRKAPHIPEDVVELLEGIVSLRSFANSIWLSTDLLMLEASAEIYDQSLGRLVAQ